MAMICEKRQARRTECLVVDNRLTYIMKELTATVTLKGMPSPLRFDIRSRHFDVRPPEYNTGSLMLP
ncbi:hypothetical protein RRF57_002839 [Xylaria bambusicola]|uniref:Uncharacterized protein n=1 Tax=Xylaria bambusicola TaxID=326684 RepID=A0AAN7UTG0_9PEZI